MLCAYSTILETRHQKLPGLNKHFSHKSPYLSLKNLFIMIASVIRLEPLAPEL